MSLVAALAACGGGGGGGGDNNAPPPPPPSSGPYAITGVATYVSVPSSSSGSLNYAASTDKPIRGATVQLLSGSGSVIATTITDTAGAYSVSLPTSQAVTVRVRAEIKRTGTATGDRDIQVIDNTSGNALYVLDSAAFTPTADTTKNVRAASGWGGSSYTATRAAAPFSILDTIYSAQAKIESAAPVSLPTLKVNWSVNNKPTSPFNAASGAITTSFFTVTGGVRSLYLLGAANTDTDEYDTHVVAHEFGHYLQNAISRDDSVGGSHGSGDKLDARVAFSEGWGNGWSGIALGNPVYSDSYGPTQASGFNLDVSQPATGADRGWYSETTAQYLVWSSNAAAGFTPIYTALTALKSSPAYTTLYSFGTALKAATSADITALYASQNIVLADAFGSGETNSGGNAANLPVYKTHAAAAGVAQNYCVRAENDSGNDGNKLGEYVYIRFTVSAGTHALTVTRTSSTNNAATDPDFVLLASTGAETRAEGSTVDMETLSIALPTGTHAIALSDFNLANPGTSCFDFKVD